MTQMPLPFEVYPDYSMGAYFVDKAITPHPLDILLQCQFWEGQTLVLCGQTASGKTHLAHIFARTFSVPFFEGADMRMGMLANIAQTGCVIDNMPNMDEETLFHLLNTVRENTVKCLMTSGLALHDLPFLTPDVHSRLQHAMLITLKNPTDAVLQNMLLKLLDDRKLSVETDVVSYIIPRLHRSYESVQQLVDTLDSHSLSEKSNITIPLVRKIMDTIQMPELQIR